MSADLISSPVGVLAVLTFVAAFFFAIEQKTKAKVFNYLAPLTGHLAKMAAGQ